eukprot:gene15772-21895_t
MDIPIPPEAARYTHLFQSGDVHQFGETPDSTALKRQSGETSVSTALNRQMGETSDSAALKRQSGVAVKMDIPISLEAARYTHPFHSGDVRQSGETPDSAALKRQSGETSESTALKGDKLTHASNAGSTIRPRVQNTVALAVHSVVAKHSDEASVFTALKSKKLTHASNAGSTSRSPVALANTTHSPVVLASTNAGSTSRYPVASTTAFPGQAVVAKQSASAQSRGDLPWGSGHQASGGGEGPDHLSASSDSSRIRLPLEMVRAACEELGCPSRGVKLHACEELGCPLRGVKLQACEELGCPLRWFELPVRN